MGYVGLFHGLSVTRTAQIELRSGRVEVPAVNSARYGMGSGSGSGSSGATSTSPSSPSTGAAAAAAAAFSSSAQGLTPVHFSTQHKHFLWDALGPFIT
jgi:hypothetical protein